MIYTSKNTKLSPGDVGVVKGVWDDNDLSVKRIDVRWNNGSNLSLIDGVDQFLKI